METLERRLMLSADWRNPVNVMDVNQDGTITALDALMVINELGRGGARELDARPPESSSPFVDVNGDGSVTALDALLVINALARLDGPQNELSESTTAATEFGITIGLGQAEGSRTYRFDVDADFDGSDTASAVQDTFAVYLVDPSNPGQTLLDRGTPGTALFTLSGDRADFPPGLVRFDGRSVEIDLTDLEERDTGRLLFQLINQDDDSGSFVRIHPRSNVVEPDGLPAPRLLATDRPVDPDGELEFAGLVPSEDVELSVRNIRFATGTGRYEAEITLINRGAAVGRDVAVAFPGLPAAATLVDAAGTTPDGTPYLSFRSAIPAGGLGPNGRSRPIRVVIDNPERHRFSMETAVYVGAPNRPPVFPAIAPITIHPGDRKEIVLGASDPDGDPVTYSLTGTSGPNMRLDAAGRLTIMPSPEQIGQYAVTVVAGDGMLRASQVIDVNVVPDPLAATRISGRVLDVDGTPLVGLQVEVGGIQALTRSDGSFTLDLGDGPIAADTLRVRGETYPGESAYPFIAEKLPFMLGREIYQGFDNVISRPIYLPKLDAGQPVDPASDTVIEATLREDQPPVRVDITAGSLLTQEGIPFTGDLSITEVPVDLTPAALPPNLLPDQVITIQPGEMVFATPAPLTFPNTAGWEPGTVMDLWSINPTTGEFEIVGEMVVSEDGETIDTTSGGIRNSSWHFPAPPPETPVPPDQNNRNLNRECNADSCRRGLTSDVDMHSGALFETHDMVSYSSLSERRHFQLAYSSARADPRHIVHIGYEGVLRNLDRTLVASLEISRDGFSYNMPGFAVRQRESTDFVDERFSGSLGNGESRVYHFSGTKGQALSIDPQSLRISSQPLSTSTLHWTVRSPDNKTLSSGSLTCGNFPLRSANGQLLRDAQGNIVFETDERGETIFRCVYPIMTRPFELESDDNYTLTVSVSNFLRPDSSPIYSIDLRDVSNLGLSGGEHFWSLPSGGSVNAALQADMRDLPSGLYRYSLTSGLMRLPEVAESRTDPIPGQFTGRSSTSEGELIHVNYSQSPWGAGWGLSGWLQLTENDDDSVLLINGDGSEMLFRRSEAADAAYIPPPGDFSTLEKLADGTFQRVHVDGTIQEFNSANVLSSEADRNGNTVSFNYSPEGRLISIVDPVGLRTDFIYEGERVREVVDPEGRSTRMDYDQFGNLVRITDPDGSMRSFNYDSRHLMIAEIDQLNQQETIAWDFSGRISEAVRKDGSILRPQSAQASGLFPSNETLNPLRPPQASGETNVEGSFVDGSGAIVTYTLDEYGQLVSARDQVGNLPQVQRDSRNRVRSWTDSRGFETQLSYDQFGNITQISDGLTDLIMQSRQLFPQQKLFAGDNPAAVEIGDLNGNGNIDLVITNRNSDDVSVLLGNGDGTFAGQQRFAAGSRPRSIAIGDVNGDGIPDLVTANRGSGDVSVLLGNGDGTFALQQRFAAGNRPQSIMIGDVNGDGIPDLVTANLYSHDVSVLLGNGDGTFAEQQRFAVGGLPRWLAIGDINGDGIPDLVTANQSSNDVSVLLGIGDGTFAEQQRFAAGFAPRSIAIGDVNGDGIPDLVTANRTTNDVSVLLGIGDGTFADQQRFVAGNLPYSIRIGDVNGDGIPDLVTANWGSNDVAVLLGNGDGTFAQQQRFAVVGSRPYSIAIGDVNGDGTPDLVTANRVSNDVSLLLGNGDGTFVEQQRFAAGSRPRSIAIGDVNGDGIPDLVTANDGSNDVSLLLDNGDGTFVEQQRFAAGTTPISIAIGDVNGDGIPDLVTANVFSDDVSVLLGNGDGTFAEQQRFGAGNNPVSIAIGDVNGDGTLDLVTANYSSNDVSVLLGNGDGTFAEQQLFSVGSTPVSIAVGDVNGDGMADLVTANAFSNDVSVLLGNGDGTFAHEQRFAAGNNPVSIAVGDFNGDGIPDLVTANYSSNDVSVLLGNGDGTFAQQQLYSVGTTPHSIAISDITGNGTFDIVTANRDSNDVSVLLGNGDGTFAQQRRFVAGNSPYSIAIGDVNGDGIPDLVAANTGSNDVSVLLGSPVESTSTSMPRRMTYDPIFNQLTSLSDELGRVTTYDIDPDNGNRLSARRMLSSPARQTGEDAVEWVESYTYTASGLLASVTDALDRITEFTYDDLGRMITMTTAVGTMAEAVSRYEYDAAGNMTATIDPNGNRTEFAYDAMNRMTEIREPDAGGGTDYRVTTLRYDAHGNLIELVDPLGNSTTSVFDPLDRLISSTDALGQQTQFTYDPNGNLLSTIDANDHITRHSYDVRDRRTQTVDPDNGSIDFRYDLDGNLLFLTDSAGNRTGFAYDARSRLIREVDPLGNDTRYSYDAVDNLTGKIDRNGRETRYEFDDLDRLTTEIWVNQDGSIANTIEYAYDLTGNLLSVVDVYSSLSFEYDELDRMILVDNFGTPGAPPVVLNYTYDAAGNRLSMTEIIDGQAGATTQWSYDALNRPVTIAQSGDGVSEKLVDLVYNELDQFVAIDRFSDLQRSNRVARSSYAYDELNRLISLEHGSAADPRDLAFYDFEYDAASRITAIDDILGRTEYSFDRRDQLTGAARDAEDPRGNESYEYDSNGNRISSHRHGSEYVTGPANRLLSDGIYEYEYDDEGNISLRTEIASGDVREFEWDHRNRLVRVTDLSAGGIITQEVRYTYDALDRRIAKTVIGSDPEAEARTEHYVYDGEHIVLEFEVSQQGGSAILQLVRRNLFGPDIDQVLAQEIVPHFQTRWMVADHLGTVREVLDGEGNVTNGILFDSYGNILNEQSLLSEMRFAFTGREVDVETGLFYYRARYYESQGGLFISSDPIGFMAEDTNLYRYVFNQPNRFGDPTGEFVPAMLLGGILGGIAGGLTEATTNPCSTWDSIATQAFKGGLAGAMGGFGRLWQAAAFGTSVAIDVGFNGQSVPGAVFGASLGVAGGGAGSVVGREFRQRTLRQRHLADVRRAPNTRQGIQDADSVAIAYQNTIGKSAVQRAGRVGDFAGSSAAGMAWSSIANRGAGQCGCE